jgi:hypothetical protein
LRYAYANPTYLLIALPVLMAQQPTHGIVTADMDLSIRPGNGFFTYGLNNTNFHTRNLFGLSRAVFAGSVFWACATG